MGGDIAFLAALGAGTGALVGAVLSSYGVTVISVAAAATLLGGAGLTVSAGMIACGSASVPITAVTIGATVVTGAVVGAGVLFLIGGAYYLYKRKKNNATLLQVRMAQLLQLVPVFAKIMVVLTTV